MSALDQTLAAQRAAAAPHASAFVAANAGAGKTRVLTDRVARLLLAGAAPSKILCITFTKAAAAEMADRLFRLLGDWALAEDGALAKALDDLEGAARTRDADDLAKARRLFARALETPGGLKIQTIHAFCESVLKRFPLEAGAPPGFSVIEEAEAAALAGAAVDQVAERAAGGTLGAAFARLAARLGGRDLRALLAGAIAGRQALEGALRAVGGWETLLAETARALGVDPEEDEEAIIAAAAADFAPADIRRMQAAFRLGGKTVNRFAENDIERFFAADSPSERLEALKPIFLTQKGEPRQRLADRASINSDPWIEGYLAAKQATLFEALDRARAARAFADTRALHLVLREALSVYEAMKTARAGLDYDDLIFHARRLFADRAGAAWVLWKLDQGLDHILLDEAQDTSPAQWSVVEAPLEEFFAGAGARAERRTFFAVGDQKQSIYSFQGADAGLFQEKRADLAKKIAAVAPFVDRPLTLSFRTAAPVLSFVDTLFAEPEARAGLGEDGPLRHGVYRKGAGGRVEVWPLTPHPEAPENEPWDAPLDAAPARHPARALARCVAATIRRWLDAGEPLASAGRPIAPGDVMILVQSRAALFHETIRALNECGVPVAGADRLKLLEDAAVEDLLSYARCVLLDTDDLSLAETLKSPFFGLDDEDLFALTREPRSSLWAALRARADERESWARAVREIAAARRIALREGGYAFFCHVLETGAPSGRRRLYARLGAASRETVDELLRQALDYELSHPRSLQGFLAWIEARAGEIKREMDQASGAVRVMTAHGAKGLEAPIVFLIDAHRRPDAGKIGPLLRLPAPAGAPRPRGLFALAGTKDEDCAALTAARAEEKRLQYEEYRRLLYVAATRARDRLYVCGVADRRDKDPSARPMTEKSWHALAQDAMARLEGAVERVQHPEGWGETLILSAPQTAPPESEAARTAPSAPPAPGWLARPAAPEASPARLAPSRLAGEAETRAETGAYSPLRPADRFLRGRTLHRLLELLPQAAPGERPAAADRLLARLAPAVAADERARWRAEVLRVLDDPAFAPVFAPTSRAEVPVAGTPRGARAAVSGVIDRIAVTEGRVLIVDYKTNRPPPARVEDAPAAYVAQLAAYRALLQEIYPDREISCALLWTYDARLMTVPPALLDHALETALV
ncbi:double-strand break repair helicase AddA [Amphiplicatus metriothermophilus]|uniref:DNA 3'-5' helicase n=1 Tax=Amphiplicatus metriothermophilus TaxID=1519374 RepID=A0A239PK29_9PROT|nr:double-strand break repair helicase AddA [Amphiplicatus metriothermophilus]MBB5517497.1 ATP-dependent helicase/nuclease subunit A [Amphiplicatus metriothermophilus]SNT68168.1 DNA helicase/exodeoxyribonuclease V, subunit A [Amphiplicatus metriothermophilus]